ncbi:uncharacterized protein [Epargyreus clarus]|uniref:uncharacterized protein n=1 Tax=Epargyreus clarus TaxID=520877 RepID=UPI003C30D7F1
MKAENDEFSFQKRLVDTFEMEVDLEKALDLAGAGKYHIFHGMLMVASLSSALLEMIGSSFVLPAAACDLDIPEHLRGILTSIPNIGVILSAPFWGRAADTVGRKPILLACSAAAGCFGLLAAFTPNLLTFALCKLAGSFFLSCPSSLGFAYVGEMTPRKRRDFAVVTCNGILTLSAALSPIIAWAVLSYDWQLGHITLQPWRVLTAVYALPLLVTTVWMTQANESPKFLMAKGKQDQALKVLREIYAVNTGMAKESFCVTSLSKSLEDSEETGEAINYNRGHKKYSLLVLLRPPHLKWLALTGFLMFGLFSLLNGLFLFAPATINKIMSQSTEQGGNLCTLMNQAENKTSSAECVADISFSTFQIMVVSGVVYGSLVLAAGFTSLAKKTQLVSMFVLVGIACLITVLTENRMVAGAAMSTLQVTALGIGPLTAYAVQLFPTSLRGTAVGAVLMFGRIGSVVGSNVAGVFLAKACAATVYGFSALVFLCAGLSFLLPREQTANVR